jgi:hypothetical protein
MLAESYAWIVQERIADLRRRGLGDEADEAARVASRLLLVVAERHPRDIRAVLLRAGLLDRSPPLASDDAVVAGLRRDLAAARVLAPRRQQVAFALAELEATHGRPDAAADALRAVVADDPEGPGAWARLAAVYRAAGRIDDARRIVREARARGVEFGPADARLVVGLTD